MMSSRTVLSLVVGDAPTLRPVDPHRLLKNNFRRWIPPGRGLYTPAMPVLRFIEPCLPSPNAYGNCATCGARLVRGNCQTGWRNEGKTDDFDAEPHCRCGSRS